MGNTTVYCGGMMNPNEAMIHAAFSPFGHIMQIKYFNDKCYAFVRFDNKESACSAIVAINNTEIGGQPVKCSWGKENYGEVNGGNQNLGGPGNFMRHDMGPPHQHFEGRGGYQGQMQYYPPQQQQYYP